MDRICLLDIDGRSPGVRVGIAARWWSRARGLWPGSSWPPFEVLQLPGCRAVHTFGMRIALDVVFSDAHGRVTSVRHALPPWRIARDPRACCTWEMRAGMARRLGLCAGTRLRTIARGRGATAVEFLLAAVLVVVPAALAVLEVAQLANARHLLQHAVGEAARQASVAEATDAAVRRSMGLGLLPLFVPLDARAALDGAPEAEPGAGLSLARGLEGLGRAYLESFRPDLMSVDLEPLDAGGRALLLRVRYCREMFFPLVRDFIPEIVRWGDSSLFGQACLARRRLPLEASAVVLRHGRDDRAAGDLPQLPPPRPGDLPPLPLPPSPSPGGGDEDGGLGDDESLR